MWLPNPTTLNKLAEKIWGNDLLQRQPRPLRAVLLLLRMGYVLARDYNSGQLSLRAMSLIYTTLLSLVPLLALSFSVLKGFGVHNQIEPILLNFLAPFGDRGAEITNQIMRFVSNIKVGVLGSAGLVLLIYTVVSLIQKIESAFNAIWHVQTYRPLSQRFSGYLSVIVMAPVLIFSAVAISQSVVDGSIVQRLLGVHFGSTLVHELLGEMTPLLITTFIFTGIYILIPNTEVKFIPALLAGVATTLLWNFLGWVFATFVMSSGQYDAIYSGFAAAIFFVIWLYLNWLLLLLGSSFAYYLQHPEHILTNRLEENLSARAFGNGCFELLRHITRAHQTGAPALTLQALERQSVLSPAQIADIIAFLRLHTLLVKTEEETPRFVLRQSPATISLFEVWQLTYGKLMPYQPAEEIDKTIQQAVGKALRGKSLVDL